MGILRTSHVSPGIYANEIDKTVSSIRIKNSQQFANKSRSSGGGGGEPGVDEYLRGIAFTDSECLWSKEEGKMMLNFYNMNGGIMTSVYLFSTNSDGDVVLDAGEFTE